MKDNNLNGRILNAYQWGGYLWWQGFDIFIDGRLDTLYPEEVFRDYTDIVTAKPAWKGVLQQWHISFVLFDTRLKNQTPKLNDALMKVSDWMILYQDPVATLFARKNSLAPDFLAKFQSGTLPIPDEPMCQYAAGMTLLHRDGESDKITRYLKRAIELDPAFAQPHLGLARLLIKENKYSDSLREIKTAEKLGLRGAELDDLAEIARRNL
jgi:tetratricopeptide (TPR) repeat protein